MFIFTHAGHKHIVSNHPPHSQLPVAAALPAAHISCPCSAPNRQSEITSTEVLEARVAEELVRVDDILDVMRM